MELLRSQCADYIKQHHMELMPFLLDLETGDTLSDGEHHLGLLYIMDNKFRQQLLYTYKFSMYLFFTDQVLFLTFFTEKV